MSRQIGRVSVNDLLLLALDLHVYVPGHQEIMIPEGLQHSSVQDIVAWFPKFGLNSVRLTFAIEMIDDYLANSPNQTLEKSVINALGSSNGTKVLNQILSKNPQFTKNTTRLQVWDDVAKELSKQGVIIHLDNHMSKAFWCCADNDENGWFGSKYFNVENWKRGLAFMAKHVSISSRLPNVDCSLPSYYVRLRLFTFRDCSQISECTIRELPQHGTEIPCAGSSHF